jgi:conjugal transfer mating pair stabilization protein TraG
MEWYVFGDLLFLADVVNGVAALTSTLGGSAMNDYEAFLKVGAIIGLIMMFVQGMGAGGTLQQPVTRLMMVFVFFSMMMVPKVTVTMENVYTGATRTIANVPFGIAFTGQLFSTMGLRLTEIVETAYSFPGVTDDGLNASLDNWRTLRRITSDPSLYGAANSAGGGDFARSWINYISVCTAYGLDVGNLSTTAVEAGNLVHTAVYNPSRSFGAEVYLAGGVADNLDCVDAHAQLLTYSRGPFMTAFKASVLAQQFYDPIHDGTAAGPATPSWALVEPKLATMFTTLGGIGTVTVDEAMLSMLVGSLYDHGAMRRLQLDRKDAYAVMTGDAIRARNAQWMAQGDVFQQYVKPVLSFIEGFWFALFPIVAVALMFGPAGLMIMYRFLQIGLWIQLWGPCIAVVNLFTYHGIVGDLANLDAAALTLTSLSGQFAADSVVQEYLGVAGLFASAVPILALLIISGSIYTMNTVASSVGGPDTISETNAAPARQSLSPLISVASQYEDTPMTGMMRNGAAAYMPKINLSSMAEDRVSSAESQMAGARTSYAQAISRALSQQDGSRGESFSGVTWRDGTSAQSSDVYRHATGDSFRSTVDEMRKAGVTDTEAASFVTNVGARVSAGMPMAKAVSGALGASAQWRTQNSVTDEQTNSWAKSIARAYSEDESLQASLMSSFSRDQDRGWRQSGYTNTSLSTDQSVREEGQDYAGSERRFEEASSFAQSVGVSANPDVAMLARRIVDDPSRFIALSQAVGQADLVQQATERAEELHGFGWGSETADSRRMAIAAGALLVMAEEGNYDAVRSAIGPDGFRFATPGDPRAAEGVGDSLGSGPTVNLPAGGVGGYAPQGAPFDPADIHASNVAEGRARIDERLGPVVQDMLARDETAAATSAAEAQANPSFVQTLDGNVASILSDRFGASRMQEGLERQYASEARDAGLTAPEAEYYAFIRSHPGMLSGADYERELALGEAVVEQSENVPGAGRAQLSQLSEASVATELRREQLFEEIQRRSDFVGVEKDEKDQTLLQRSMR